MPSPCDRSAYTEMSGNTFSTRFFRTPGSKALGWTSGNIHHTYFSRLNLSSWCSGRVIWGKLTAASYFLPRPCEFSLTNLLNTYSLLLSHRDSTYTQGGHIENEKKKTKTNHNPSKLLYKNNRWGKKPTHKEKKQKKRQNKDVTYWLTQWLILLAWKPYLSSLPTELLCNIGHGIWH